MENIADIFYKKIIPEALEGSVDCELPIRIVFNVYIKETNTYIKATDKYKDVIIPTLIINDCNLLVSLLEDYVDIMLNFYDGVKFTNIDKQYYKAYLIATAIANMGIADYLHPEIYFQNKISAIKDNPFTLDNELYSLGTNEIFNSEVFYSLNKETPNEECPFKYTLYLKQNDNLYEFQTIRFFINNDTAYIGAIQGNKPAHKNDYQKKINRILYKANENITPESELYNANPGAIVTLISFIALLNKNGITNIAIADYGIQRWNDKKILYHNLQDKLLMQKQPDDTKLKVTNIIERTQSYFDKAPHIKAQLANALLRFNYHFPETQIITSGNKPAVSCPTITGANNNLLFNIYEQVYSYDTKKLI